MFDELLSQDREDGHACPLRRGGGPAGRRLWNVDCGMRNKNLLKVCENMSANGEI
jgi:hypothetical protein